MSPPLTRSFGHPTPTLPQRACHETVHHRVATPFRQSRACKSLCSALPAHWMCSYLQLTCTCLDAMEQARQPHHDQAQPLVTWPESKRVSVSERGGIVQRHLVAGHESHGWYRAGIRCGLDEICLVSVLSEHTKTKSGNNPCLRMRTKIRAAFQWNNQT